MRTYDKEVYFSSHVVILLLWNVCRCGFSCCDIWLRVPRELMICGGYHRRILTDLDIPFFMAHLNCLERQTNLIDDHRFASTGMEYEIWVNFSRRSPLINRSLQAIRTVRYIFEIPETLCFIWFFTLMIYWGKLTQQQTFKLLAKTALIFINEHRIVKLY